MSQASVALVVPCFDEEARLDRSAFLALVDDAPCLNLVFVDDGSRDQTLAILHAMARERPDHIEVVALPKTGARPKRYGRDFSMRWQVRSRLPASSTPDLSTPPAEIRRLTELAQAEAHDVLMGSRVHFSAGLSIANPLATISAVFSRPASLSLGLPVYDTQCGAKLFRRTQALAEALREPFSSRWAFDVELLARLIRPRAGILAIPSRASGKNPLTGPTFPAPRCALPPPCGPRSNSRASAGSCAPLVAARDSVIVDGSNVLVRRTTRPTGENCLLNNYGRAPIVMSRGAGCELWDVDGSRTLDMTAGIAVCVLGHVSPGWRRPSPARPRVCTTPPIFISSKNRFRAPRPRRSAAALLPQFFFCNLGTRPTKLPSSPPGATQARGAGPAQSRGDYRL